VIGRIVSIREESMELELIVRVPAPYRPHAPYMPSPEQKAKYEKEYKAYEKALREYRNLRIGPIKLSQIPQLRKALLE